MMSFASSSLLVVVGLRPSVLRDGVMGSFLESLAQDSFPGHLNHLGQSLHRGNLGLNHRRIVQGGNGTANRRCVFPSARSDDSNAFGKKCVAEQPLLFL